MLSPVKQHSPAILFTEKMNDFNEDCLKEHNRLRALHGCAELRNNRDLQMKAQNYAEYLAQIGRLEHSEAVDYGENLAIRYSPGVAEITGKQATLIWYEEIKSYDFKKEDQLECGHFSQVIWRGTEEAGFGLASTADGHRVFVVGNYLPPGNFSGEWVENVFPPLSGQRYIPTKEEIEGIHDIIENTLPLNKINLNTQINVHEMQQQQPEQQQKQEKKHNLDFHKNNTFKLTQQYFEQQTENQQNQENIVKINNSAKQQQNSLKQNIKSSQPDKTKFIIEQNLTNNKLHLNTKAVSNKPNINTHTVNNKDFKNIHQSANTDQDLGNVVVNNNKLFEQRQIKFDTLHYNLAHNNLPNSYLTAGGNMNGLKDYHAFAKIANCSLSTQSLDRQNYRKKRHYNTINSYLLRKRLFDSDVYYAETQSSDGDGSTGLNTWQRRHQMRENRRRNLHNFTFTSSQYLNGTCSDGDNINESTRKITQAKLEMWQPSKKAFDLAYRNEDSKQSSKNAVAKTEKRLEHLEQNISGAFNLTTSKNKSNIKTQDILNMDKNINAKKVEKDNQQMERHDDKAIPNTLDKTEIIKTSKPNIDTNENTITSSVNNKCNKTNKKEHNKQNPQNVNKEKTEYNTKLQDTTYKHNVQNTYIAANYNKAIEGFRNEVLLCHNKIRQLHKTKPLQRLAELDDLAQKWAEEIYNAGKASYSDWKFRGTLLGENVSDRLMQNGWISGDTLVGKWYQEAEQYDYKTEPITHQNVGHFTQVVWSNSDYIGVGLVRRPQEQRAYVVCFYHPPGNLPGSYTDNVKPPLVQTDTATAIDGDASPVSKA